MTEQLLDKSMKDMLAHWEKLQADAVECGLIRDRATDEVKRELYARLAESFRIMATEVERVVTAVRTAGVG